VPAQPPRPAAGNVPARAPPPRLPVAPRQQRREPRRRRISKVRYAIDRWNSPHSAAWRGLARGNWRYWARSRCASIRNQPPRPAAHAPVDPARVTARGAVSRPPSRRSTRGSWRGHGGPPVRRPAASAPRRPRSPHGNFIASAQKCGGVQRKITANSTTAGQLTVAGHGRPADQHGGKHPAAPPDHDCWTRSAAFSRSV